MVRPEPGREAGSVLAGRAVGEGGEWLSQPIRRAVSNVAEMSEALWVPDLGLELQSTCSLVSAFSRINSL